MSHPVYLARIGKLLVSFIMLGILSTPFAQIVRADAPLSPDYLIAEDQYVCVVQNTPTPVTLQASDGVPPYTFSIEIEPDHGTLTGTLPDMVYTPNLDYLGPDEMGFRVTDSTGASSTGIIFLETTTQPFSTNDQSLFYRPGTWLNINVEAIGGCRYFHNQYWYRVSPPAHGTLRGLPPNLQYRADDGFRGIDSFTVEVKDWSATTLISTIRISTADPIVAPDLDLLTLIDTPIFVSLSASGGYAPLTLAVDQEPANGVLSGIAPNVVYTPDPGFIGIDTFTYTATDLYDFVGTGTVTIDVAAGPPAIVDQTVETGVDVPVAITAEAADGVGALIYTVSEPPNGTLTGTIPNLLYTPDAGFYGIDSFTVQVTDSLGTSATATITITVHDAFHVSDVAGLIAAINAANITTWPDRIILAPGTYTLTDINNTDTNGSNGLPLITTDITIWGNGATITRSGSTYFRFFAVSQTGILTLDNLTLTNGYNRYYAGGAIFNQGILTITNCAFSDNISGYDSASTIFDGGAIYSLRAGTGRQISITNTTFTHNTGYGLGGALYVRGTARAEIAGSTFSDNQALQVHSPYGYYGNGGAIYTGSPSTITTTSFIGNRASAGAALYAEILTTDKQVSITDSLFDGEHVATGTAITVRQAKVYITGSALINHVPVVLNETSVLGTTSDYTANHASITESCIANNDGRALYEALNYAGIFAQHNWWGAADGPTLDTGIFVGSGQLIDADVDYTNFLTTPPVAGCPVMPPGVDIQTVYVMAGSSIPITLAARGGLPPYSYSDLSTPAHGILSGPVSDLIYTPDSGYDGPDSFTFTAADSVSGTAVGTVEIRVMLPIQAVDQTYNTDQNAPLVITLSQSGGIPPYAYTVTSQPTHGVLVSTAPDVIYIPDEQYLGSDAFTYRVQDANGVTAIGTITITVNPAPPATIVVNSTTQELPFVTNGNCTLGEAITAANTDTAVDGCAAGSGRDIIDVPAGTYTVTTGYGSTEATALPSVWQPVIIRGAGWRQTILMRSGSQQMNFFYVTGQDVTIERMTLRNGGSTGGALRRGGAIYNSGSLTVLYTSFESNHAGNDGGAIYNGTGGTLTSFSSAFTDSSATFRGGAIFNNYNATATIWNSLFYRNRIDVSVGGPSVSTYGFARLNYSCMLDTGNRTIMAEGNGSYDARYNWWGETGTEYTIEPVLAQPALSVRPAICSASWPPEIFLNDGDVAGLAAAIEYANTLENVLVKVYLTRNGTYTANDTFDTPYGPSALPMLTGRLWVESRNATITKAPAITARLFTVDGGELTFRSTTISNGRAEKGAAIYATSSWLQVASSDFLNNAPPDSPTGDVEGGAIYVEHSQGYISDSDFSGNISDSGGGILLLDNTAFSVQTNRFAGNEAAVGSGIYVKSGLDSILKNNCFTGNTNTSLANGNTENINAPNNWWGTVDGPSGAGSGSGDAVGDRITFAPFLTDVPYGCVADALRAVDQSIDMSAYDLKHSITLQAVGGRKPYTFAVMVVPTHGTLSGTMLNLTYTSTDEQPGSDSFTLKVTDTDGRTALGMVTINRHDSTIIVTSTAQEVPFIENGNCTLGEAIQAANTDTAVDGCTAGSGSDRILLSNTTYTLDLPDNMVGYNGIGLPIVSSRIVFDGSGAVIERNAAPSTPIFRIFWIKGAAADAEMRDLSIRNGYVTATNSYGEGAGILNEGLLHLSRVTLENNVAEARGGAIYLTGSTARLTMQDSFIHNNESMSEGGGLYIQDGWADISNTVISDNRARWVGGGVFHIGDHLTISDSIIENNTASAHGGGIYNSGRYPTITTTVLRNNSASEGGTLYNTDIFYEYAAIVIEDSCILDHSPVGVFNRDLGDYYGGPRVYVKNVWWGSSTGPGGIGPGYGTVIKHDLSAPVYYLPFKTESILGCEAFAPTALPQTLYTAYERSLPLMLSAVDGVSPYTFENLSTPAHGTVTGTLPDIIYTPENGFNGTDSFTFDMHDSRSDTSTGTITVVVAPLLAVTDQTHSVYHTQSGMVSLTASSATGGRPPYTFENVTTPAHGVLSGTLPDLTYTPDPDFGGTDTFTFDVRDRNNTIVTGTVSIHVAPMVTVVDRSLITFVDTALPIQFSATDGWPPYEFQVSTPPVHGMLIGTIPGLTYVPDAGYSGTDTLTFQAADQLGGVDQGLITINVTQASYSITSGDLAGLIAAINAANASADPVIIDLAPDGQYTLSTPLPTVTGEVTLRGNGSSLQGGTGPSLLVSPGGVLTINELMITGSSDSALRNDGGTLLVISSTLYNNTGQNGGAIDNAGGVTQIVNTTLSGNTAQRGGAIYNLGGTLTITNATITSNQAGLGGGLYNASGETTLENSIVTNNSDTNCAGAIISNGHNIDSGSTCALKKPGDRSNTNPNLDALHDNNGPTLTQALRAGSAGIDAGADAACYWADQRGVDRPQDGNADGTIHCDIGAYEYVILAAPTYLTITPGSASKVNLTWIDHAADETAYRIERSSGGSGNWIEISSTVANISSYADSGLDCGTTYSYRVRAYRTSDNLYSNYSNTASITTPGCVPLPAPSEVVASTESASQIDVIWTDNSSNESAFSVERSPDGLAGWSEIVTTQADETSYSDTELTCGTIYYYRVRAYRGSDERYSAYSNTASAVTSTCPPPTAPGGLTAAGVSTTQIDLVWTDNSSDETAFSIERSPEGLNVWLEIDSVDSDVTTYTDSGLLCATAYDYRVRAYRGGDRQYSAYSNVATGQTTNECAPLLHEPSNGALINDNQPTFTWEPVAGVNEYRLQVDDDAGFGDPEVDLVTTDTSYTPTAPLADNTTYYWRVQATNGDTPLSDWSMVWSFTVDIARLRAPLLALPKDRTNTADQTPTLSWNAVSGAKGYQVQWSSNPDLAGALEVEITTLTKTLAEQPYGIYFWRVRAKDAAGRWSDWSITRTLTITILSTPTNAQHVVDTTPTFTWKAVAGVVEYHLVVYKNKDLTEIAFEFTGTGTTITPTQNKALGEQQHWWKMQVRRGAEFEGWTPVWTFTVTPPTTVAPKLISPANYAKPDSNTLRFEWQNVPGGARYQIQIDNNDTFASPVQDEEVVPVGDVLSYTASPLPDGGTFYWRVRAINSAGVAGAWSAARSFVLQPIAAPVLLTPPNPKTVQYLPLFTWNTVLNADTYEFQLSPTSSFAGLVHHASDIPAAEYTVPDILPDGKYFWRVRGVTAADIAGKWSSAWVVILDTTGPAQPVLYTPQDLAGTADTTPTFTWLAAAGGKQYHLEVATNPTFTGPLAVDRTQAGLTYPAPSALDYGTYFWRVQAADVLGNWGDFSPARRLAITLQKTPKDGATTTDTTPTFTWAAVTGAAEYELQVDISPAFGSLTLPFYNKGPALTATAPTLNPDTYYWHVRALPDGDWMPTWTLVISPTKPAQVVLSAPASGMLTNDNTPTLSWKVAANANSYQIQIDNQGTFTSPEQDVIVGNTTSYIAADLADGTYSWRVRAVNSAGAPGAWSYKRTFTVDTVPLAVPVPIAPLDGASSTNTKLTLSWGAVTGTFRYQIQLDPNPDFPLPVIDAGTLLSYKSPTPLSRGNYFWHVRTLDKAGNVSAWSETRTFTIVAGATAPPLPTQTPIPTDVPIEPTDEVIIDPTLEPTVEPTLEPTSEPTTEPTSTPAPSLFVVESDDICVQTSGSWTAHNTPLASGGRYLYSSGSADDTLSLSFTGSRIDIIFVQHPALGSFALEVDGTLVQTVNSTAPDAAFGVQISLGLSAGVHTMRIVPVSGVIAIDAFAVEIISEPPAPLTPELTDEPVTPEPTAEPVTLEPLTEPQTQPTPNAPASFGHG